MPQASATRCDRAASHLPREHPPGVREEGTHSLTRKAWLTSFSTDFSLCTCCSCFRRMTSGMRITFRAKKRVLFFSRTSCTRPNVPVPAAGRGGVSAHGPQHGGPAPRRLGHRSTGRCTWSAGWGTGACLERSVALIHTQGRLPPNCSLNRGDWPSFLQMSHPRENTHTGKGRTEKDAKYIPSVCLFLQVF